MAGELFASYQIIAPIGAGGMSVVYEAVERLSGRHVAVKMVHRALAQDADLVRRFLMEARTLSAIHHVGVVRLLDHGCTADGTLYLVLERLRGESLFQRQQRLGGQLSLGEVLVLCHQVASIMADLHDRGLVHRDIKPGNVFVTAAVAAPLGLRVKLLDFGLVKVLEESGLSSPVDFKTQAGLRLGTPDYMSPEQCLGEPTGPEADVYALGSMIFRLLSGRPPFLGKNVVDIFNKQISHPAPALTQATQHGTVPPDLDVLVAAMLRKLPAARPTMRDVAKQLAMLNRYAPCAARPRAARSLRSTAGEAGAPERTTPGHALPQAAVHAMTMLLTVVLLSCLIACAYCLARDMTALPPR